MQANPQVLSHLGFTKKNVRLVDAVFVWLKHTEKHFSKFLHETYHLIRLNIVVGVRYDQRHIFFGRDSQQAQLKDCNCNSGQALAEIKKGLLTLKYLY